MIFSYFLFFFFVGTEKSCKKKSFQELFFFSSKTFFSSVKPVSFHLVSHKKRPKIKPNIISGENFYSFVEWKMFGKENFFFSFFSRRNENRVKRSKKHRLSGRFFFFCLFSTKFYPSLTFFLHLISHFQRNKYICGENLYFFHVQKLKF